MYSNSKIILVGNVEMKKIILQISGDEINIHKASRFHGWLMDQLEGEYAEKLHDEVHTKRKSTRV